MIQHGEGGFTLEDEYDLQKWDPYYENNDPTAEVYGADNGIALLDDTEDINDDRYDKYIGAKLILDKIFKNGGNLETVIR